MAWNGSQRRGTTAALLAGCVLLALLVGIAIGTSRVKTQTTAAAASTTSQPSTPPVTDSVSTIEATTIPPSTTLATSAPATVTMPITTPTTRALAAAPVAPTTAAATTPATAPAPTTPPSCTVTALASPAPLGSKQTAFITSTIPGAVANVSVGYPDASASAGESVTTGSNGSARVDFKVQYRSQAATVTVAFYGRPPPYPTCMTYFKAS